MDMSISTRPASSNAHKRHRDVEASTSRKRTKDEIQPGSGPDLSPLPDPGQCRQLNRLTTKQRGAPQCLAQWLTEADSLDHMMEWLTEADALHLMAVGRNHQISVTAFYNSRLKYRLCYQPTPTVMLHPYDDDKWARWTIVKDSLHLATRRNKSGKVISERYEAQLQPHRGGPIDSDEALVQSLFRPRFGPAWRIASVTQYTNILPAGSQVSFTATLKPIGAKADHPAYLYRDPLNRFERYIPTDSLGTAYLGAKKIYVPLSKYIGNRFGMTVAKAEEFIQAKRAWIADQLISGGLSSTQKETFKNPLFAEHLECDRIPMSVALQLAQGRLSLFFSLSLLPLFRAEALKISDLNMMSENGIQLLHDCRLVKLLTCGVLKVEQLTSLTKTQFFSILILQGPLAKRQLSSRDALALTPDQLNRLHKAGLFNDLARGRIALQTALQRVSLWRDGRSSLTAGTTLEDLPVKTKTEMVQEIADIGLASSSSSSSSSSYSSSHSLRSSGQPNSSTSLSPLRSGTMRRETAPRPKTDTMKLSKVALLVSKWPVHQLREAFSAAREQADDAWIAAFRRVSQHLPGLQEIENPDFSASSSSSSSSSSVSSIPLPSFTSTDKSTLAKTVSLQNQQSEVAELACADVALVLSRMPTELVDQAIIGHGYGGDAQWIAAFGQVIHLMPIENIMAFLDTEAKDEEGDSCLLFHDLKDGLVDPEARAVAGAFNQIFINLAQHLSDKDYLALADLFLTNDLGFMVAWSFLKGYTDIINQCREIWSLVQARCAISNQPIKPHLDVAVSGLVTENDWSGAYAGYNGTSDETAMAAFASLLMNLRLASDASFLRVWTGHCFDEEPNFDQHYRFDRHHLGYAGLVACHALFSPFRQSEYATTAQRYMSRALDKAAEGFDSSPDVQ